MMKQFMRDLLMAEAQKLLKRQQSSAPLLLNMSTASASESGGFQIEEIAIRASIEYCLAIDDVDYLFGQIYTFFDQQGFSN